VSISRKPSRSCIPGRPVTLQSSLPAGAIEDALLASILLMEIPGGKVEEASAATG